MDMWNRWGIKTIGWGNYFGWEEFKKVEKDFTNFYEEAKEDIRRIWIEFRLN